MQSSPDLAHRTIFWVDALSELVSHRLGGNRSPEERDQVLVRTAPSQCIAEIQFLLGEKTQPDTPVGCQTHTVAVVTIWVAHRAYKPYRPACAGQPVEPCLAHDFTLVEGE